MSETEISIDDYSDNEDSAYIEYDITSYPSDHTIDVLAQMRQRGDIVIPEYQRKYVWNIKQASLLVESFLLGLPVPPLFFYVRDDNRAEVIDGQQRLLSMMYFLEGYFGEPDHRGKRQTFKLTGLSEKSPFQGHTISTLDDKYQRKIKNSVLRAINIRQLSPVKESTSVFHIFERLNTGGTSLKPQEIRNAVFRGNIVAALNELNKNSDWREILGLKQDEKNQKDIELILRLFALYKNVDSYEKPMKEYLNKVMNKNRSFDSDTAKAFTAQWPIMLRSVRDGLGNRPFRPKRVINAAVLEAVMITILEHGDITPDLLRSRYDELMADEAFTKVIRGGTTDTKVVKDRITRAREILTNAA